MKTGTVKVTLLTRRQSFTDYFSIAQRKPTLKRPPGAQVRLSRPAQPPRPQNVLWCRKWVQVGEEALQAHFSTVTVYKSHKIQVFFLVGTVQPFTVSRFSLTFERYFLLLITNNNNNSQPKLQNWKLKGGGAGKLIHFLRFYKQF